MERVWGPLARGKRRDMGDTIAAMLEYEQAGKFRRELAEKIIYAQIALAKAGFSTGGRPPFGFRRWLAKDDGTPVRELAEGERVRMAQHHVVWLPGPDEELDLIRRILKMLETMPASRVARQLNQESIPSPDAGRWRTDNGVKHQVSGVWHQTTVANIARNPLLVATVAYGCRSMGDQLRFSPEGPRELADDDFRGDDARKVVRNGEADRIAAKAKFEPLVNSEKHQKLLATLDSRAGSQRGKPRAHDPSKNPLGCRVYDINCSWPMYREPYRGAFRYKCGLYQQTHGQQCAHNHVDGLTATRFALSCIRQRLLSPRMLGKLEQRLRQFAAQEQGDSPEPKEAQAKLSKVTADLEKAARNLALAETPDQHQAIAAIFNELKEREAKLKAEIADCKAAQSFGGDAESEVAAVMELAEQLTELARDGERLEAASRVVEMTNAKLFLAFQPVKVKKRTLNKIHSGVVTFGAAPPPIPLYEGATARAAVKDSKPKKSADDGEKGSPTPKNTLKSDRKGKSLGNVSRGDWI